MTKIWNYCLKCKNFGIFYLILKLVQTGVFPIFNKKVLLHEHKRHTAHCVAIAISCYLGGRGGPLTKIFFPSLNMYQAKSGVKKNFPFIGGGSLDKNFFPQSEHVSSQIWCQKFFPLLGGSLDKNFFPQSEHVSSQIWCQKFFPLLGWGPLTKSFFPVWTCIKPNLVSKNFPFTETGCPPKNLRPGTPQKIWDLGLPPKNLRPRTPPSMAGLGTPPVEVWTDTQSENITFPILRMWVVMTKLTWNTSHPN